MRLILALIILSITAGGFAQGDDLPVGARQAGMGNASITLGDLWSLSHNQAGLASLDSAMVGVFYQSHFLSNDLSHQGIGAAVPLGTGTIGLKLSNFGFDLYSEQQVGLAYAMRLSEILRAGVQLNYMSLRFGENYGSVSTMVVEVGVQADITKALSIGVHAYNPGRAKIGGPYDDRMPTLLSLGLGYTFSDKLLVTTEVEKDIEEPESIKAGLEYHPSKALFVRIGVGTQPVQGHAGVGIRLKSLDIDLATAYRSQLGPTPQIGLNYRF